VATAIYLGFAMLIRSYAGGSDPSAALLTGLATLTAAAFAPVVLVQGIRFAEAGGAHAARGFAAASLRTATTAGGGLAPRLASLAATRTGASADGNSETPAVDSAPPSSLASKGANQ
jgi:hypothetical protein